MVDLGPLGPVNVCCGAYPGHRDDCRMLMAALTDEDRAWLTAHGWRDPDEIPSGQAFLDRYYSPGLISSDAWWPWRHRCR